MEFNFLPTSTVILFKSHQRQLVDSSTSYLHGASYRSNPTNGSWWIVQSNLLLSSRNELSTNCRWWDYDVLGEAPVGCK
jgi:hypothetical protein